MITVVDASVALKWVVEEERSAEAASMAELELVAPELLLAECANALWTKARRRELMIGEVRERIEILQAAPLTFVSQSARVTQALRLASILNHPVYDWFYLALAIRDGGVVVTADRHFLEAARSHSNLAAYLRPLIAP